MGTGGLASFIERHWSISAQMLKFLISGGTVALTELAFLYIFTHFFGIWYLFSLVLSFIIAFCISFTLQKFWTFGDARADVVHIQMSSYLMVSLTSLAVNAVLLYIFVQYFAMWYIFAQILIDIIIAGGTFLIYKFHIFKKNENALLGDQ